MAQVQLDRLQQLQPAEEQFYQRYFEAAGGVRDSIPIPGAKAAELLQQSRLPKETLRHIWAVADNKNSGSLDFEAFCVACRLVAHAQLHGPDAALSSEAVAQAPTSPPVFKGVDDAAGGGGNGHGNGGPGPVPAAAANGSGAFDFEASALGVDGGAGDAFAAAGGFQPGGTDQAVFDTPTVPRPPHSRRSAISAAKSGKLLGSIVAAEGPASARKLEAVLQSAVRDGKLNLNASVAEEVFEVRRKLDDVLGWKSTLERRISDARGRVEALRDERRESTLALAKGQADVQHLTGKLNFARQVIGEIEKEIESVRASREAFSQEELNRVTRKYGPLTSSLPVLDDRQQAARTAAVVAQERSSHDERKAKDLGEKVQRTLRRKVDLQAQRELALANQRQAQQDRSYAQQAVEQERANLEKVQADRLASREAFLSHHREATRLAKDAGLGPGIVTEMLAQLLGREASELGGPAGARGGGGAAARPSPRPGSGGGASPFGAFPSSGGQKSPASSRPWAQSPALTGQPARWTQFGGDAAG